jgi:hypothetical protein
MESPGAARPAQAARGPLGVVVPYPPSHVTAYKPEGLPSCVVRLEPPGLLVGSVTSGPLFHAQLFPRWSLVSEFSTRYEISQWFPPNRGADLVSSHLVKPSSFWLACATPPHPSTPPPQLFLAAPPFAGAAHSIFLSSQRLSGPLWYAPATPPRGRRWYAPGSPRARRSGLAAATPPAARPPRLVRLSPSPRSREPAPLSRCSLQSPVWPVAATQPPRPTNAMVRPRRAPHRSGAAGPFGGRGRPPRPLVVRAVRSRSWPASPRGPQPPRIRARSAPPMVSPPPFF